ncbi:hypothetical protein OG851_42880 (plasmid) [Streptomyces sp. NBC_00161]|uniref:tetratricopeptide repeat protein n=1 Tax=Streptomyces sp. NBC_00161 TaxID=2975671 RepID=UPI003246611D
MARALPGYVSREHDRALGEAVRDVMAGHSRIVVLVGTSSTGKTRACWEAVQPLADERWLLWHPFDPTRAEAALEDLHRVLPRTVVWLNEAQHYLGNPTAGERIAAAVHHLLVSPERGPILILGTLWPEYAAQYTALPTAGEADPYSRARELLAGRNLTIPDAFDPPALAAAEVLAEGGDRLLADALTRARTDGRMTQDLAGAPELLHRYRHASPAAKAVLEAAMDARRLGVGLHLPQAFLTDAATDYLGQNDYDQLTDDWAERAYAELAEPVHGKQAPLRRTTPRPPRRPPTPTTAAGTVAPPTAGPQFRLADYLEQHSRTTRRHLCPPASFWHAAHTHLTHPDDLSNLSRAARARHRLQWAHHLLHRAADHGSGEGLSYLAELRENAGDRAGAEVLARQAADHGDTYGLYRLALLWEKAGDQAGAEALARQAADHGSVDALSHLALRREAAGDRATAEALAWLAGDQDDGYALSHLADLRENAGNRAEAEALLRQAVDQGSTYGLYRLALLWENAGDQAGAEALARQAADQDDGYALSRLAELREKAGDQAGAEALLRQAVDHGSVDALSHLAELRENAGDQAGAEALAWQAASHGHTYALSHLAELRENAGDQAGAEALAWQAASHGHTYALSHLAELRENAGSRAEAEALLRQAVDQGSTYALSRLAELREKAGDQAGGEALIRQAADEGDTHAVYRLAVLREMAGDQAGAEALARQAVDHGNTDGLYRLARLRNEPNELWPNGLDPDGTPTAPWT